MGKGCGMAGPANLHQIRFLLRSELGEQLGAVQERLEGRMGQLADELADKRKEGQCDEKGQQGMGQGSDMMGWQQDVMREMREIGQAAAISICDTVGQSVDRPLQMEEAKCMLHLQQLSLQLSTEGMAGGRRVAEMRNEVVEQLGGVEQRVKLLGQHMSEMDGVMKERMQEHGEIGRQVQHCVLELDRLPARLESVPEQLGLLGQRLDEMNDMMSGQLREVQYVRSQVEGLGVVKEKVEEIWKWAEERDEKRSDEMKEVRDEMKEMRAQLSLLPGQLRLLGRQCDEVKGQLGRSISGQGMMGQRVEEMGKEQRDIMSQLEKVGDEQNEMLRSQGDQMPEEVREAARKAGKEGVREEVNEGFRSMRQELQQVTREMMWMKKQCDALDGIVMEVMEAGRETHEARQGFDKVEMCTECIWQFLVKEVGYGFGPCVGKDVAEVHEVMSDAVEGMRLVAKDMIMRQGKFEEVVVECRRQELCGCRSAWVRQ